MREKLHLGIQDSAAVSAPGAAVSHDIICIYDSKIRQTVKWEIRDTLVQVMQVVIGSVPDKAHEVFQSA